jgi:hypothetical protein
VCKKQNVGYSQETQTQTETQIPAILALAKVVSLSLSLSRQKMADSLFTMLMTKKPGNFAEQV